MRRTLLGLIGFVIGASFAGAEQQPALSQIVPTIEQLGQGWASNHLVVLLDPLSFPRRRSQMRVLTGWRQHGVFVAKPGRAAYGVVPFFMATRIVWFGCIVTGGLMILVAIGEPMSV